MSPLEILLTCAVFVLLLARVIDSFWERLDRRWRTRSDACKTCLPNCQRERLAYWIKCGGHLDDPYP